MRSPVRLVAGAAAGDTFPLDRLPIMKKNRGDRKRTERGQMLERTLRQMKVGEHFTCDFRASAIYKIAAHVGIRVELRKRKPDGFHVWRKS